MWGRAFCFMAHLKLSPMHSKLRSDRNQLRWDLECLPHFLTKQYIWGVFHLDAWNKERKRGLSIALAHMSRCLDRPFKAVEKQFWTSFDSRLFFRFPPPSPSSSPHHCVAFPFLYFLSSALYMYLNVNWFKGGFGLLMAEVSKCFRQGARNIFPIHSSTVLPPPPDRFIHARP